MDQLTRINPESVGLNTQALKEYLEALDKHDCHSVMVLYDGKVVLEKWWEPYGKEYKHVAYSLSKSFSSIAVGFAVQEGLLTLESKVAGFFPELFPYKPCENMLDVTIKDLLTMSFGHRGTTDLDFFFAKDWLEEILHLYLSKKPGTDFFYDNRCAYLCSVIITKLTGKTVYEYLVPRLFEPLGIKDVTWEERDGINPGGWGLNIKTEDIARFAQFLLNKGSWNNNQLIDQSWIELMGSNLISNQGKSVYDWPDWEKGYGLFTWQCVPDKVFRGDGAFGQFAIVAPNQKMAIAITAGSPRARDLLEDTWIMFEKVFHEERNNAKIALEDIKCEIPVPPGDLQVPKEYQQYSGKTFLFPVNPVGLEEINIVFGDIDNFRIKIRGETFSVNVAHNTWLINRTGYQKNKIESIGGFLFSEAACAGAWSHDEYVLKIAFIETPFVDTMRISFANNAIKVCHQCYPVLPLRMDCFELYGLAEKT